MANLLSNNIVLGVILAILSYMGLKLIDAVLKHFYDKVIFSYLWNIINREIKKRKSKLIPINTDFVFSLTHNDVTIDKSKENIEHLFNIISEDYKEKLETTKLHWDRTKYMCSSTMSYNDIKYEIELYLKIDYTKNMSVINSDYITKQTMINNEVIVNGISFKITTSYSYEQLQSRILSLVSIINILKNDIEKLFIIKQYSGGNIIIKPLKSNYQVDLWIQNKRLQTTLILNGENDVHVNLRKDKAEITFNDLILFDDVIYDYINEIVLNYYI